MHCEWCGGDCLHVGCVPPLATPCCSMDWCSMVLHGLVSVCNCACMCVCICMHVWHVWHHPSPSCPLACCCCCCCRLTTALAAAAAWLLLLPGCCCCCCCLVAGLLRADSRCGLPRPRTLQPAAVPHRHAAQPGVCVGAIGGGGASSCCPASQMGRGCIIMLSSQMCEWGGGPQVGNSSPHPPSPLPSSCVA